MRVMNGVNDPINYEHMFAVVPEYQAVTKAPYHAVKTKSKVSEVIIKSGFLDPNANWAEYYSFNVRVLPVEWLVEQDKFLRDLYNKHPFQAGVLYSKPHTIYNWHTDSARGVGINMLLEHTDSHCIFHVGKGNPIDMTTSQFHELVYEPHKYYLFNTQVHHSVMNFDGPRFIFSIEFAEDKNVLSYDKLLEELR